MRASASSLRDVLGRNTVHPFPARMAAGVALEALAGLKQSSVVLDPMAGSGTTLAIGRANGHRCIGFDVDPLAVLISRVWTQTVDVNAVRLEAARVLKRAERFAAGLRSCEAFPIGADEETRAFIRFWFDGYVRRQLAGLSKAIGEMSAGVTRETLWCAFSRQIIAKHSGVSLALDLAHSRPHRVFDRAPQRPLNLFLDAVERVIAGCVKRGDRFRGPRASVSLGDARMLPLADRSVDLVFTSPPYLNAIDYLRCSKFSLVWMGYSVGSLREIRSRSIGAEVRGEANAAADEMLSRLRLRPALPARLHGILRRYIEDTNRAIVEVTRVLAPRGQAMFVVGENTIRGTYLPTADLVVRLGAMAGLHVTSQRFRDLANNHRYLPPPGDGATSMDGRMRREAILTFSRRPRA